MGTRDVALFTEKQGIEMGGLDTFISVAAEQLRLVLVILCSTVIMYSCVSPYKVTLLKSIKYNPERSYLRAVIDAEWRSPEYRDLSDSLKFEEIREDLSRRFLLKKN